MFKNFDEIVAILLHQFLNGINVMEKCQIIFTIHQFIGSKAPLYHLNVSYIIRNDGEIDITILFDVVVYGTICV